MAKFMPIHLRNQFYSFLANYCFIIYYWDYVKLLTAYLKVKAKEVKIIVILL